MTKEEIIEMAMLEAEFVSHGKPSEEESELFVCTDKDIVRFSKLVAERERKKIKHFLTATSVSVQTRVYIGDEEISMLKMTHEEIRARGQE